MIVPMHPTARSRMLRIVASARMVATALLLGGLLAIPGRAALPPVDIMIDGGSPYFLPSRVVVTAGTPIRWHNPTATHHTVTADGCLLGGALCAFDSGSVDPNASYTIPSLPAGRYPYHCRLHPIMRGILVIVPPDDPTTQT